MLGWTHQLLDDAGVHSYQDRELLLKTRDQIVAAVEAHRQRVRPSRRTSLGDCKARISSPDLSPAVSTSGPSEQLPCGPRLPSGDGAEAPASSASDTAAAAPLDRASLRQAQAAAAAAAAAVAAEKSAKATAFSSDGDGKPFRLVTDWLPALRLYRISEEYRHMATSGLDGSVHNASAGILDGSVSARRAAAAAAAAAAVAAMSGPGTGSSVPSPSGSKSRFVPNAGRTTSGGGGGGGGGRTDGNGQGSDTTGTGSSSSPRAAGDVSPKAAAEPDALADAKPAAADTKALAAATADQQLPPTPPEAAAAAAAAAPPLLLEQEDSRQRPLNRDEHGGAPRTPSPAAASVVYAVGGSSCDSDSSRGGEGEDNSSPSSRSPRSTLGGTESLVAWTSLDAAPSYPQPLPSTSASMSTLPPAAGCSTLVAEGDGAAACADVACAISPVPQCHVAPSETTDGEAEEDLRKVKQQQHQLLQAHQQAEAAVQQQRLVVQAV